MSNFHCHKCGKPIIENEQGKYVTGCEHYPKEVMSGLEQKKLERRTLLNEIEREHEKYREFDNDYEEGIYDGLWMALNIIHSKS